MREFENPGVLCSFIRTCQFYVSSMAALGKFYVSSTVELPCAARQRNCAQRDEEERARAPRRPPTSRLHLPSSGSDHPNMQSHLTSSRGTPAIPSVHAIP